MTSPAQAIVNAERTDGQINAMTTQMALLHDTPFVSSMFYNVTTLLCTHLVFYRLSSVLNRRPDKSALPHGRMDKTKCQTDGRTNQHCTDGQKNQHCHTHGWANRHCAFRPDCHHLAHLSSQCWHTRTSGTNQCCMHGRINQRCTNGRTNQRRHTHGQTN